MAKNNNLTDFVRDLADGFREKLGWETTDKINPQDFRDFIAHSPSVGALTTGLETLNWTKTLNVGQIAIECPPNLERSLYYNVDTSEQLLPLIQFRIVALDPIAEGDSISIQDMATEAFIGKLTKTKSEVRHILPVFGDTSTPNQYPRFPTFYLISEVYSTQGVRVQMTATWVQIGSTQFPIRLSGATMGGIK